MPRRPDLAALTGLGAFAAAWVVLYLYRTGLAVALPPLAALDPVGRGGYLGVDLFFVLSGFILTYNYAGALPPRPGEWLRFLGVLLARIYPVHLATTGIVGVGLAVAAARGIEVNHPDSYSVADLVKNLLLVHAWSNDYRFTWNEASWSISCEWAAYLVFPLILFAGDRIRRTAVFLRVAAAVLALQGAIAFAFGSDGGPMLRVAGECTAGCALGRYFLARPVAGARWSYVAVASGLLAALSVVVFGPDASRPVAIPLFGVLVYALARSRGAATAWLAAPFTVFWGEASYAVYMTHQLVSLAGDKVAPLGATANAPLGARSALVLACAATVLGSGRSCT